MAAAHGMIAVDTNVLVRFIARDDARQAAIAGALIAGRSVYISKGVLMEIVGGKMQKNKNILGRSYNVWAAPYAATGI